MKKRLSFLKTYSKVRDVYSAGRYFIEARMIIQRSNIQDFHLQE